MINHYHILEVAENATDAEIKAAYKKKALQYHPDKNAGDPQCEEMFKMVNAAYQVLSNPYERARFELKLKFGEATVDRPPPSPYRKPYTRPNYAPRDIDHRTNDRATLWAFGISLGIAIVVMSGMQLINMYNQHQHDLMLGKRRVVFDQARDYHNRGQIASCLTVLETLGTFYKEEEDIEAFKLDVLDDQLQSGTRNFYQERYADALSNFQIFEEYAENTRLSFEVLHAETHMMAGNHDEAISRFNKLIVTGNNTIENNLKVALIYREGKRDYQQAMNYYQIASKMAVNGYKSMYGEAYPLLLNSKIVPPQHFDIFHGMALTFYYLEDYQRSLSALKWNTQMWPDYPENYILKGQIFEKQDRASEACDQYDIAVEKGWTEPIQC